MRAPRRNPGRRHQLDQVARTLRLQRAADPLASGSEPPALSLRDLPRVRRFLERAYDDDSLPALLAGWTDGERLMLYLARCVLETKQAERLAVRLRMEGQIR